MSARDRQRTSDRFTEDQFAGHPTTVVVNEGERDWNVTLEWDEEGEGWVTFVPVLNNISTYGDTREEALARTHEAIRGYLTAVNRCTRVGTVDTVVAKSLG